MKVKIRTIVKESLQVIVVLDEIHPELRGPALNSAVLGGIEMDSFCPNDIVKDTLETYGYSLEDFTWTFKGDALIICFMKVEDGSDISRIADACAQIARRLRDGIAVLLTKMHSFGELLAQKLSEQFSEEIKFEIKIGQQQ